MTGICLDTAVVRATKQHRRPRSCLEHQHILRNETRWSEIVFVLNSHFGHQDTRRDSACDASWIVGTVKKAMR